MSCDIKAHLIPGNRTYMQSGMQKRRIETAENGQHLYTIVIALLGFTSYTGRDLLSRNRRTICDPGSGKRSE